MIAAAAPDGTAVLILTPAESDTLAEILGVAAAGTLTRDAHTLWCDLLDVTEGSLPLIAAPDLRPLPAAQAIAYQIEHGV